MLWFTLWSSFWETSELYAFCHGAQLQGVAVLPVSHYVICYGIKILGYKHELLLATECDGRNILFKTFDPLTPNSISCSVHVSFSPSHHFTPSVWNLQLVQETVICHNAHLPSN
jgi:hypothetical protein